MITMKEVYNRQKMTEISEVKGSRKRTKCGRTIGSIDRSRLVAWTYIALGFKKLIISSYTAQKLIHIVMKKIFNLRWRTKFDDRFSLCPKVRNVIENNKMVTVNRNNKAYGSNGSLLSFQDTALSLFRVSILLLIVILYFFVLFIKIFTNCWSTA